MHVACGWSLRETAVQAKLAGIAEVSDVALLGRLRDAEGWLRQLCLLLLEENGVQLRPVFSGPRGAPAGCHGSQGTGARPEAGGGFTIACACPPWSAITLR